MSVTMFIPAFNPSINYLLELQLLLPNPSLWKKYTCYESYEEFFNLHTCANTGNTPNKIAWNTFYYVKSRMEYKSKLITPPLHKYLITLNFEPDDSFESAERMRDITRNLFIPAPSWIYSARWIYEYFGIEGNHNHVHIEIESPLKYLADVKNKIFKTNKKGKRTTRLYALKHFDKCPHFIDVRHSNSSAYVMGEKADPEKKENSRKDYLRWYDAFKENNKWSYHPNNNGAPTEFGMKEEEE